MCRGTLKVCRSIDRLNFTVHHIFQSIYLLKVFFKVKPYLFPGWAYKARWWTSGATPKCDPSSRFLHRPILVGASWRGSAPSYSWGSCSGRCRKCLEHRPSIHSHCQDSWRYIHESPAYLCLKFVIKHMIKQMIICYIYSTFPKITIYFDIHEISEPSPSWGAKPIQKFEKLNKCVIYL